MHYLLQKFNLKNKNKDLDFGSFSTGDEIIVGVKIPQGDSFRIQDFQGLCIAKRSKGMNSNFIVRKISDGSFSVQRNFMINSPLISYIKKVKSYKIRRAKAYFMEPLKGKSSRLKVLRTYI